MYFTVGESVSRNMSPKKQEAIMRRLNKEVLYLGLNSKMRLMNTLTERLVMKSGFDDVAAMMCVFTDIASDCYPVQ